MRTAFLLPMALAALLFQLVAGHSARADEGLWLFTDPPRKQLMERYRVELTQAWLDHVGSATVHFSGATASFVSANGLILTNHHISTINWNLGNLSRKGRDYVRDGFLARSLDEELRFPDLELEVLVSVEDVTRRVRAAMNPAMSPAESCKARMNAIRLIEQECSCQTGRRGNVIPLFEGHKYQLYRYETYTDVRLVFAPETQVARIFDVCFLRAYENSKPAKIAHPLRCCPDCPALRELVLMAGHPGRTLRQVPLCKLECQREADAYRAYVCRRWLQALENYRTKSKENLARTEADYFRTKWDFHVLSQCSLLLKPDSELIRRRGDAEVALRDAVQKIPRLRGRYANASKRLEEAVELEAGAFLHHALLERGDAFASRLFYIARELVRLAEEMSKAEEDRFPEYCGAKLESTKRWLFSEAPIHEDLEIIRLANSLALFAETVKDEDLRHVLADHDALLRKVLAGKKPEERAAELIRGTRLRDVKVRRALFEGGRKAIAASDDSLIALARLVDQAARRARKQAEEIEERIHRESLAVAAATREVKGPPAYPDGTGTLRLSFGQIKKHDDSDEKDAVALTLADLFERPEPNSAEFREALAPSWKRSKSKLKLNTPLEFVCNADGSFGNSGSPILNSRGDLIGVAHGSHRDSLQLNFEYDDKRSRLMFIPVVCIVEVLGRVYGARELVEELILQR